jgi:phosphatidate phosphatase PAH1
MWLNKFVSMMCSACEPQVLISGVTDVIVVRDVNSKGLISSPFYLCFGTDVTMEIGEKVLVSVNNQAVPFNFHLDDNGYIHPNMPASEALEKFDLRSGKNVVEYTIGIPGTASYAALKNEVYLFESSDRLVVSDVDGTLTKSDVQGMYNNYHGNDYLHDNYANLMQTIHSQGYKVVWMTMRSLPMYNMSKEYIRKYVQIEGPLLMEPEDLMLAVKKETLTRTSDLVKATAMKGLK